MTGWQFMTGTVAPWSTTYPTARLRFLQKQESIWSPFPVLQQLWIVQKGNELTEEWRDVPLESE